MLVMHTCNVLIDARTSDSGDRSQAQGLGTFSTHDHNSAGTVIEGRGIGSGDCALRIERGLQGGDLVELSLLELFVFLEQDWVTLLLRQRHGDDFVDKLAVLGGLSGSLVDLNGVLVLLLTSDVELLGSLITAVTLRIELAVRSRS